MARNWAITIGINGYRYLQRLDYAMPDADAVRQFFTDDLKFHQVYHFTDTSLPILQDHGPDLNSQPTSTTLNRFLRTRFEAPFLRDGDNLWFFFAGHGIRHNNRDYLMPLDGDRDDLERSAIPLHYVSERLRRSGADNIILLIDACRSYEGRRDGFGIGREKQQGVITLFSCSPEESSYEIQELQQGAFTHVLLDSLRLQGEGNCATVERLYQRLRRYVPQITRQYKRVPQTPYGVIEPLSKNHLILLPQQATLTDVTALKNDALTAELARDAKTAKRLWIRVLVVSPGDPDAIEGIERLSRGSSPTVAPQPGSGQPRAAIPTPPTPISPTPISPTPISPTPISPTPISPTPISPTPISPTPISPTPISPTPISPTPISPKPTSSKATTLNSPTPIKPKPSQPPTQTVVKPSRPSGSARSSVRRSSQAQQQSSSLTDSINSLLPSGARGISRRRALQVIGFAGGSIGTLLLGRAAIQSGSTPTAQPIPQKETLTAADFTPITFETVTVNETGEIIDSATKEARLFQETIGETRLDLMPIPGGTFMMGSPDGEGADDERPQHEVTVEPFLMGRYEVTQAQWKAVAALPKIERDLDAAPSNFTGDNLPVEQVSWDDVVEFCKRLSQHSGRAYRLPTEAEWEYACRAETTTPFHFGKTITTELANYRGTNLQVGDTTYSGSYGDGPLGIFREETTSVGNFPANAFGLHDMHGNVWEWCQDYWHDNYEGAPTDGSAWVIGGDDSRRLLRGGSWVNFPDVCRSAFRHWNARDIRRNYVGFRVMCGSSWTLA